MAHLDADLRDLRLEALELGQGASQVEVRLPRPAGVVPVRIRGGASQVRIRRPAGVPVQLRVGRGVADLRFDEQEWGAVGGGLRLVTPEATQVPDRYEIEIASGATHLEISAEEGSNRP
ncbi:MAG: transcriptional regulatory protein [Actinomycetia bacterium]|nr:transcriptional regulatory protein [Actinomycetes bacterium]